MATGQGTATIDFGAFPGANEASVVVSGQTSILATSKVEAYIMGDDTAGTHTASDHRYVGLWLALRVEHQRRQRGSLFTGAALKGCKANSLSDGYGQIKGVNHGIRFKHRRRSNRHRRRR